MIQPIRKRGDHALVSLACTEEGDERMGPGFMLGNKSANLSHIQRQISHRRIRCHLFQIRQQAPPDLSVQRPRIDSENIGDFFQPRAFQPPPIMFDQVDIRHRDTHRVGQRGLRHAGFLARMANDVSNWRIGHGLTLCKPGYFYALGKYLTSLIYIIVHYLQKI